MLLTLIRVGMVASIITLLLSEGMRMHYGEARFVATRPGLLARSVVCVLVLVPLATLVVVRMLRPPPAVAVGLAILSAAPLSPMVLPKLARAHGDVVYARSLHLTLAPLAVVTTPLVLIVLGNRMGMALGVSAGRVAAQIFATVVAPLGLGFAINLTRPRFAEHVRDPMARAATIFIGAVFALIAIDKWHVFLHLSMRGYGAMAFTVAFALLLGHTIAGRDPAQRRTLAFESAARNPGLAMMIAQVNFPGSDAAAVLLPYLVVFLAITALYSALLRRRAARKVPPAPIAAIRGTGQSTRAPR